PIRPAGLCRRPPFTTHSLYPEYSFLNHHAHPRAPPSCPTRRSSDLDDFVLYHISVVLPEFVLDFREPAEMVEAEVSGHEVPYVLIQHIRIALHDGDRHVAYVEQTAVVRKFALQCFGHDGRRIRIVHDPCIFRIGPYVPDQFDHVRYRTHAVCHAARTACLLAEHAVPERDLFILLAHFEAAGADLQEGHIDVSECRLLIRRILEFFEFRV